HAGLRTRTGRPRRHGGWAGGPHGLGGARVRALPGDPAAGGPPGAGAAPAAGGPGSRPDRGRDGLEDCSLPGAGGPSLEGGSYRKGNPGMMSGLLGGLYLAASAPGGEAGFANEINVIL